MWIIQIDPQNNANWLKIGTSLLIGVLIILFLMTFFRFNHYASEDINRCLGFAESWKLVQIIEFWRLCFS